MKLSRFSCPYRREFPQEKASLFLSLASINANLEAALNGYVMPRGETVHTCTPLDGGERARSHMVRLRFHGVHRAFPRCPPTVPPPNSARFVSAPHRPTKNPLRNGSHNPPGKYLRTNGMTVAFNASARCATVIGGQHRIDAIDEEAN